jgi:hypothetical protein
LTHFEVYKNIRERPTATQSGFYSLLNGEREYDRNLNKTKQSGQDECMEHESQVGTAIKKPDFENSQ